MADACSTIDRNNVMPPQQFPHHKASRLSDLGIHIRRICSRKDREKHVTYAHQDDYYNFGIIEKGSGKIVIDFNEYDLAQGDLFIIQPGQVHHVIDSTDEEGWLFLVDNSYLGDTEKQIFDDFLLFASSVRIDRQRMCELTQIATIMEERIDRITDNLQKTTVRRLVEAMIGIIAEVLQETSLKQVRHSRRNLEIVQSFRRLLNEHIATDRSPSHYASLLNISPVYLNEVIKKVTGSSAASYIKNEVVLRAKRLLVHTDLAIKEISDRLGIDDYAYFSRLFSKTTGVSPSVFRQRNLE